MKKVILFFSAVAALVFVSCAKQSLGYGGDELELVIEELEGSATKAALTNVELDTYGGFKPKSQVLTAKLKYKSSGADVTGKVVYVWDPKLNGCALSDPDRNSSEKNTLTATKAGSGTISVSATYKGQEVQSSDLPVSVTEYELASIRLDVSTSSDSQNKFVWINGASTYTNVGMGWNGPDWWINYYVLKLFAVYNRPGRTPYEKQVPLMTYPVPDDYEEIDIHPDVTISFPDLPDNYYIRRFDAYPTGTISPYQLYYFPQAIKGYKSGLIGEHTIKVSYKGKTVEQVIEYRSDYNYLNSSSYDEFKIALWQGRNDYTITNGGSVNLNTNDFSFKVYGGAYASTSEMLEKNGYLTVVLSKSDHTGEQVLTRRGWDNAEGGIYQKPVFGAALSAGNYILQIYYLNHVLFSCTLRVS